jgi:ATP-dependent Clp protease ATP-binding subunit ClpX
MLEVMFEAPSRTDVNNCVITKESVQDKITPALTHKEGQPSKKKEESA